MSLEQYKNKNRNELWDVVVIQAEVIEGLEKENNKLTERCKPSKVVMIGDAGHYVSEPVFERFAELEKELTETKNIIVAHQTADADGYIDDYGWVANWHEMEEGMISLFEAHKLEQQAKGLDNLHKEIEDGGSSSLMTFILKEEADSLRHQAKALKEQG